MCRLCGEGTFTGGEEEIVTEIQICQIMYSLGKRMFRESSGSGPRRKIYTEPLEHCQQENQCHISKNELESKHYISVPYLGYK